MRPGDRVADSFVIERFAASGGMGDVYLARDERTNTPVAVKILQAIHAQAGGDRFEREAQLLATLQHPAVPRYVAHGRTSDGSRFLAMEWLEGEDLRARLGRGVLEVSEAVSLARRVADGLAFAHSMGVVHRDIKPENIFLLSADLAQAKLLDFGVARAVRMPARAATRTGVTLGTPGYMSPEQARGGRDVDARADVFSLGCVLFECLTGQPAFAADNVMAVLAKVLLDDAPRVRELLPDIPETLDAVVACMMAKSPAERFADGAAARDALDRIETTVERLPGGRTIRRSITAGEQRVISVIVASSVRAADTLGTAPTLQSVDRHPAHEALSQIVHAHGGRLEWLAEGSAVALLAPATSRAATDYASDAARCALEMRRILDPAIPMALATGRAILSERWPAGDAIDRAARIVRHGHPHETVAPTTDVCDGERDTLPPDIPTGIRIDEVTAGLLDARFDVRGDDRTLFVCAEREATESARTLLGKRTECVGREREIATLEGVWAECASESVSRAVLVTGAAGVGKSRLRYEFVQRVHARNPAATVWTGRGDAMAAGAPFGLLAPSIRHAAGIIEGEPLAARRLKLRARVSRSVRETDGRRVADFLGEMIGTRMPDDDSVQLRAARLDPMVMGDQMRRAWEDFLDAECDTQPVLMVLEDLHWGDLPSVALLERALRNVGERPWMLLALARPDVHEVFPSLWAERGIVEIRLGELSRRASERLVRSVLGDRLDDATIARIVERAAGNAFYLEELMRAVASGSDDDLPETVLAMVEARLGALDPESRRLLRAASVFGQLFWESAVALLLGVERRDPSLRARLDDLDRREIVARLGEGKVPGEVEYSFRHSVVREAAWRMLTEEDRVLGHRLAGQWLAQSGAEDVLAVAEHFERGEDGARAAEWFERAAQRALDGNDLLGAATLAARGIACHPDGPARARLRKLEAEGRYWRAQYREADVASREALDGLERFSSAWYETAARCAVVRSRLGDATGMLEVCAAVREDPNVSGARSGEAPAPGGSERISRAIAMARIAAVLTLTGHSVLGAELLAASERVAGDDATREPAVRARILDVKAMAAKLAGDPAAFTQYRTEAGDAYDVAGDVRNSCMGRVNLGYGFMELGRFDDAEREIRAALAEAERMELNSVATSARHNLGYVLCRLGRMDEARRVESLAIEVAVSQGDKRMEYASRFYLARILSEIGDLDAAEREVRVVLDDPSASPPFRAQSQGVWAMLKLKRGAHAEALDASRQAVATIDELGGIEDGESLSRVAYAEALHATGDLAGARDAISRAGKKLRDGAAQISDESLRSAFLANIPEHVRTLALEQEWLRG